MKEPPEAGSLSALNLLAANPPRYPVNPTEEPREPLTLYISRVPGTRDIILSTLKPQRKNVTSEDVANALYYVHLDLPSDGLLAPTAAAAAGANVGANVGATAAPTVVRKPLPSKRPAPPAHTDTSLLPNPPPPVLTGPPSSATFPLTSPPGAPPSYSAVSAAVTDQPPAPPPHREPVSPRPPQPWVPPGFRLDEHHSFDVTTGAGATPATTVTPATGPAVVTGVDTLPSQRPQQPQQPQQQPGQPFPATSLPIRSRPLPGRTLPANNHNNGGPSQSQSQPQPQPGPPQPGPSASHQSPAGIPRKPVGPRLDGDAAFRPQDKVLPHPPQQVSQPSAPAVQQQQQQRILPPAVATSSSQSTPSNFVPFQLTLIRRDAANNHQWNIGKIASVQQVQDDDGSGSDGEAPLVNEQPSIRIHLETSGYAKFRGDDGGQSFARRVEMAYTKSWTAGIRNAFKRHERSSSEGGEAPGVSQYGQYQHPQDPDLEPPRRFLRPRGNSLASTADSALGYTPDAAPPLPPRRSKEHSRSTSPPLITRPGPGLKPKGYTFTSPWDGRCDFRTGNGGRSLKCRHILHPSTDATTGATGGGVAGYNPLVIAQSFRDGTDKGLAAVAAATSSVVGGVTGAGGGGGGGPDRGRARSGSLTSALTGAVGVSELRFNLPHGDLIRKRDRDNSEDGERGSRDQLYGRFQDHLHHLQHRRRGSSTEEEDEDYPDEDEELDLSLGREKAGGGNRGKRAKLGKLIIYDDGFKMLDLVVAANMGIWWVSWERIF